MLHHIFTPQGRLFTFIKLAALLAALSLLIGAEAMSAGTPEPSSLTVTTATGPSCRYGIATVAPDQSLALQSLNAGWHLNFSVATQSLAPNVEFVPVIRVRQKRDGCTRLPGYDIWPPLTDAGLGAAIRSRPGSLWIFGNEPDRGPNLDDTLCTNRMQDDTAPDVYARAFHEVYSYIKRIDSTARVASAGLVEITPGRLQYLDTVWNAYRNLYGVDIPVDVWNMHLYVLPETNVNGEPNGIANVAIGTDPALAIKESGGDPKFCADSGVYCYAEHDDIRAFSGQIVAMRQWMKAHGQQQKPLIVSEYSVLYPYVKDASGTCWVQDEFGSCFTPDRIVNFLNNSIDYLETTAVDQSLGYAHDGGRLVQRWLWFATWTNGAGYVSNLTDVNGTQLTLVGNAFATRAAAAPRTVNLIPAAVSGGKPLPDAGGSTYSALLTAEIRNEGTVPVGQSITVNFYRDAALTNLIGSATAPAGVAGCGSGRVLAQKSWSGLPPGLHSFWVKVDANSVIGETQEDDNVLKGSVFIPTDQLWLPAVLRNGTP